MNRVTRTSLIVTIPAAAAVLCALAVAAVPRPPADVLRRDLQQILARPEYRRAAGSTWLNERLIRFIRAILQWWDDHIAGRMAGLAETAPVLYWTIVGLCVLILAVLIYHIYLTMRSAFGTDRRRVSSGPVAVSAWQLTEPPALLEQADAAARAGAFPDALRYLYLALIHHLDRREILRYDAARTNQEYLRQARKFPAIIDPLRTVTRFADRAWYGHYGLGAADYAQCRELVQTVWQEAEHVAAG